MIGLLLNVLVFLVPAVMFYLWPCDECVRGFATLFTVGAIAYLIANIAIFLQEHYKQVKDIEMIEERKNRKCIYEAERTEISEQAKLYLGKNYPDHEKELFRMITSKNVDGIVNILPAFPEINTSKVLTSLVNRIHNLYGNVCNEDHRIEELKRQIRVRKRNLYNMSWFLPTYEEEN